MYVAPGQAVPALALQQEAISKFLPDASAAIFQPTQGGLNNLVVYVCLDTRRQHVLRIYNNGFDTARVEWEHEVLR